MESKPIRTTIELPRELHRRIHEAAARKGCSVRTVMLEAIAAGIEPDAANTEGGRSANVGTGRLDFDNPPIPAAGRKLGLLTNEELYELIEFP